VTTYIVLWTTYDLALYTQTGAGGLNKDAYRQSVIIQVITREAPFSCKIYSNQADIVSIAINQAVYSSDVEGFLRKVQEPHDICLSYIWVSAYTGDGYLREDKASLAVVTINKYMDGYILKEK
jgi:hypothetical protein